jgi:TonB family protein
MSRGSQGRRLASRRVIVAVALSSAVAHAGLIATVDVRAPVARAASLRSDEPWTYSCQADAALAAGLGAAACASPTRDGAACLAEVDVRLALALDACAAPPVEVAFVDVDQLDLAPVPLIPGIKPIEDRRAAELIADEVAAKLEEVRKPVETARPVGQVVEITRPAVEEVPDQARFLAEFDSKVAKQTVARGSTEEMVARPASKPDPLLPTAPQETPPTPDGKAGKAGAPGAVAAAPSPPGMLAMRQPTPPEAIRATAPPGDPRGGAPASIEGILPRRGERTPTTRGATPPPSEAPVAPGGEGGEGGTGAPDLRPTAEQLERVVGGGSVDHLEGIAQGDETALNARQWKYGPFFNRLKRQVAQNWHPDEVYVRRDPSGNVYGTKDRLTVLQVALHPGGTIAKLYVVQPSGVDFLDDEAMRAFREAQPFPNPPSGLVDPTTKLITFSFGFHFQIGGDRGRWRVYRADE